MDAFSPIPALIGGALIGLASALLWLGNGRIAGISGILAQAVPVKGSAIWRGVFLVFLVLGALGSAWLFQGLGVGGPGGRPAELVSAPTGWNIPTPVWLAIAGLLTGIGTRIANGCTSGHGVCGLARLSPRSFVAVGIFFSVAIVTVAVTGVV
jgi:uncharacterized membrane protein YedE/YeeE